LELLALVPELQGTPPSERRGQRGEFRGTRQEFTAYDDDYFGDQITKKDSNMLRIGFQNVGGFTLNKNKLKDNNIRYGIQKWEFDIFGFAEMNIDWRLQKEHDKLYYRTKGWFESLHLSYANNCTSSPLAPHQWGGTALFSINKAAHRVIDKGCDKSKLGRWCWTRYRGKNNLTLTIITGYRPNPPSGPLSVYAQHRHFLNQNHDTRCPRLAFLQDICAEIREFMEWGDQVILMLDGNTDMRYSDLSSAFESCQLKEAILDKHGHNAPSTFRRNNTDTPIDGIWASPGIKIAKGGYFPYDSAFLGTDHRCLWLDISFTVAFGHNMPAIIKPVTRRLHCKDPRIVTNFTKRYETLAKRYKLRERVEALDSIATYPLALEHQYEYETLDKLRCEITASAEKRCRKLRMGQVAFSPQLQKACRCIKAWSLLQKKQKGMKVSSRLLQRSLKKANISYFFRHAPIQTINEKLRQAYKDYFVIKGSHRELRNTYLENLAEALSAGSNTKRETMLKQLKEREKQRNTARKIKYLRGKMNTGSTTMVSIDNGQGGYIDITGKQEMEQAIMENNEKKYKQSHHTPFFQFPLVGDFGFKGLTMASQAVLSGVYESNYEIDPYAKDLLNHLHMPSDVKDLGPQKMELTVEAHRTFWRKAKENTSCYPDELSFSTMKAGASSDYISTIDSMLTRIPLNSGYSPSRWRNCIDVMILKRSGVTHLSGLRTICLFPVDCNYAFKHVGREMMTVAEKTKTLAPEQYGSRQHHRAIDLAVNKSLTNDVLRQLKKTGAICSNDAKSCYDLIGHTQASIAMQRHGVPQSFVDCMFTTLQDANHRVRTGYGDSTNSYGGSNWVLPMHGVGQGNGAGPAIWAVVSTPLLNMIRSKGLGCHIISPISKTHVSFVGYSFVDDTDLIQTASTGLTHDNVVQMLQESIDTWEGGLKATCGAIVPEKTFWYLIDFVWNGGEWRYKLEKDCPGHVFCNDINGDRKCLRRVEPHQAETTLGVDLAPDGSTQQQAKKMIDIAIKWADAMRSGRISRSEAWLAINSTIWKTLTYPLSAINLSKDQCERIMAPILNYGLPAIGVCRNFPRSMVFAPTKYMGLGLQHLYTIQEIERLKDMIQHTFRSTTTGQLYRTSLELLYIELGLTQDLDSISFSTMSGITTDSLVKSSWNFLQQHNILLKHDISFPPQRIGDRPIMDFFKHDEISTLDRRSLNRCRLFLRAFYISDISDGYGTHICEDAWKGVCTATPFKIESWPAQGPPTRNDWEIWRKHIKLHLTQRGLRLKEPLGAWLQEDPTWPWYYSPEEERLYSITSDGWLSYAKVHKRNHRPLFSSKSNPVSTLPLLQRATVYRKGSQWVCSGYAEVKSQTKDKYSSFSEFLAGSIIEEKWCLECLDMSDEGISITNALKNGTAIAVSDGSYKETFGTAAFVLEGVNSNGRIVNTVIAPGNAHNQSPYRSELTGIYATMVLVQKLCKYYDISSGQIEFACDGLSALNKAFSYVALISVDEPSYDLLAAIRHQWLYSSVQWKIRHVKGHQDDERAPTELDRWERLNVEMDGRAKAFIQVAKQRPRHFLIKSEPWSLWYQGKKIVKDIKETIYEIVHSSEARDYWSQKEKVMPPLLDSIQWDAVNQAMKSSPRATRVFIAKHTVGMCGVGKFMHRWKQRHSPNCPRCGEFEDAPHVWLCRGSDSDAIWQKSMVSLAEWMESVQTDPDVQEAILSKLSKWRTGSDDDGMVPFQLQPAIEQQNDIGWSNFIEGWVSFEWELVQQSYYDLIQSRRSGLRWLSSLITKLWQTAWDLWEHRNGVLHKQENMVSAEAMSRLNRRIRYLYIRTASLSIPHPDKYLFTVTLQQLLSKDVTYKKAWITNVQSFIQSHGKIRQAKRMMHGMRRCMGRWLHSRNRI
jgi:Reverse transcriptase (RNA-dependent DNA polymerase)